MTESPSSPSIATRSRWGDTLSPPLSSVWVASLIGLCAYAAIALPYALSADHSVYSFSAFQMFRIVSNNLHHPGICGWNAMTHPAASGECHLYQTMFAPGYAWLSTLPFLATELTPTALRVVSVALYGLLIPALAFLAKRSGVHPLKAVLLLLLAPELILWSAAMDCVVTGNVPFLILLGVLCSERTDPFQRCGTLGALAFAYVFLNFFIVLHLGLFLGFFLLLSKPENRSWRDLFPGLAAMVAGGATALGLSWAVQLLFGPAHAMSFMEYFHTRGPQAITATGLMLKPWIVLDRFASFLVMVYPLAVLLCVALALCIIHYDRLAYAGRVILAASAAYLAYFLVMGQTSYGHFFFSFFFLLLAPVLLLLGLQAAGYRGRWAGIVACAVLAMQAAFLYHRVTHLQQRENPVDAFLERELRAEDWLVRSSQWDPWPLNLRAPERTLFLDPLQPPDAGLAAVAERRVAGYTLTSDTVYYLRPTHQKWTQVQVDGTARAFLFTQDREVAGLPLVASHERFHDRRLCTFRIYRILDSR